MVSVNGEARPLRAATVAELLGELGLGTSPRGVAVALDGEIVPRGRWGDRELAEGARVEIVTATQGG
jgi:sulfur carrier protein